MFKNIKDRISVRLNQSSSEKLEHDACLVLDTLIGEEFRMSQTVAVKVALQSFGIQVGIIPPNSDTEMWQFADEERVARRIVAILQDMGVALSENKQQELVEKITVNEWDAFQ